MTTLPEPLGFDWGSEIQGYCTNKPFRMCSGPGTGFSLSIHGSRDADRFHMIVSADCTWDVPDLDTLHPKLRSGKRECRANLHVTEIDSWLTAVCQFLQIPIPEETL